MELSRCRTVICYHGCLPAVEDEPEPGSGHAGSHARCPLGIWTDDDLTELYCTLLPVAWDVVGNSGLTVTLGLHSLEADFVVSSKPWGPQLRTAWGPLGLGLFLPMGCA